MSESASFSLQIPAKVNFYLRVVRRRDDGYHEVETVLQSVGLHDQLTFAPADGWRLTTDQADLPVGEDNLVARAAAALRTRYPEVAARGAHVHVRKRIPVGAGLGGGSADAAAALVGLARLWEVAAPPEALNDLAQGLGADVPFFLAGGSAVGRDRGQILEALPPPPPRWLVLVKPPFSVDTPWAYGQWNPSAATGPPLERFLESFAAGSPAELGALLRNDLEPGVAAAHPAIGRLRDALLAHGALGARMTGSGSAVFGLAAGEEEAVRLAAALGERFGEVFVVPTVGKDGPVEPVPAAQGRRAVESARRRASSTRVPTPKPVGPHG